MSTVIQHNNGTAIIKGIRMIQKSDQAPVAGDSRVRYKPVCLIHGPADGPFEMAVSTQATNDDQSFAIRCPIGIENIVQERPRSSAREGHSREHTRPEKTEDPRFE
jgi:hypothetical protein